MTDVKDNSSLPLLLTITGAVLAVAAGGWFLLNQQTPSVETNAVLPEPVAASLVTGVDGVATENADTIDADAGDILEAEPAITPDRAASPNIDVELSKARLAANAEILILPESQSALYYYGRVLDADPEHAIATAELDAILARVSQTVTQHLDLQEFDDAYDIARLVAKQVPEHELVVNTQQTLDQYTEQLVQQAIQLAQDGNDDEAEAVLASVTDLPARNPEYISAVRDSIAEIREVRLSAEIDRAQRARLAENQARAAWVNSTRSAIEQGNLIAPAGASARDLLAERNSWAAERAQLRSEYSSALLDGVRSYIGDGRLDDAEAYLIAAEEISDDTSGTEALRASLDDAFIEAESNRIVSTRELVVLKSVSPTYPRRAAEREQSGWVLVLFTVTPDGETANIEVGESEPGTIFNRAAVDAVEQWLFEPVEYRGRLISQRAAARLVFRME